MKVFIPLMFVMLIADVAMGQVEYDGCQNLKQVLLMKEFQEHYWVCTDTTEQFNVLDMSEVLDGCKTNSICGKKVVVAQPDSFLKSKNVIGYFDIRRWKSEYAWLNTVCWQYYIDGKAFIAFYGARNNATMTIEITGSKEKPKYTVTSRGVF